MHVRKQQNPGETSASTFSHGPQCPPGHTVAPCPTESAAGASLSCLPHPYLGNLQEFITFQVAAPLPHLTKGAVW